MTARIFQSRFANGISPLILSLQVAVKFERCDARCPQLRHEYKVYRGGSFAPSFTLPYLFVELVPADSCSNLVTQPNPYS